MEQLEFVRQCIEQVLSMPLREKIPCPPIIPKTLLKEVPWLHITTAEVCSLTGIIDYAITSAGLGFNTESALDVHGVEWPLLHAVIQRLSRPSIKGFTQMTERKKLDE